MELTVRLGASGGCYQLMVRSEAGDRPSNQDALDYLLMDDWLICALADGAGGHRGGEVAARYAVSTFLQLFQEAPTQDPNHLLELLGRVNQGIQAAQQAHTELSDMHTTFCALVLNQQTRKALWIHTGDSRIYHFTQNILNARTRDHSLQQWMQDHHEKPLAARNLLYSALGEACNRLQVEVSPVFTVRAGDWLLLCSDGLWEHFTEQELGLVGINLWRKPHCCQHLHQLAISRAQGRADNISSMILFMDEE